MEQCKFSRAGMKFQPTKVQELSELTVEFLLKICEDLILAMKLLAWIKAMMCHSYFEALEHWLQMQTPKHILLLWSPESTSWNRNTVSCFSEKNETECCMSLYIANLKQTTLILQVLKKDLTDCSNLLVNQPSFLCPSKMLVWWFNKVVSLEAFMIRCHEVLHSSILNAVQISWKGEGFT